MNRNLDFRSFFSIYKLNYENQCNPEKFINRALFEESNLVNPNLRLKFIWPLKLDCLGNLIYWDCMTGLFSIISWKIYVKTNLRTAPLIFQNLNIVSPKKIKICHKFYEKHFQKNIFFCHSNLKDAEHNNF